MQNSGDEKFEKIYSKMVNNLQNQMSNQFNSNPYVVVGNFVHFIDVKNDLENGKILHTLISYDLENLAPQEKVVQT